MDKRRIYISAFLLTAGIAACVWSSMKPKTKEIAIETEVEELETLPYSNTTEESRTVFPVYICGAVNQPGIFEIEESIYLYQLIEMAGGFTTEADLEHIDRVYLIDRPQSLYIPRIGESLEEQTLSAPLIGRKDDVYSEDGGRDGKININTAGVSELSQLPGIGPATAEKIINYRETNGKYQTKEDIMKVSGIGESKFEKIKDLIFAG